MGGCGLPTYLGMVVVQPLIIALNMVLIVWAFRVVDSLDAVDEQMRER